MSTAESERSYPLQWPEGWPRTKWPEKSAFGRQGQTLTIAKAVGFLEAELARLGALHVVISTDVKPRIDGRTSSAKGRAEGPGAAVYFTLDGERRVLACDKWTKTEENLWAIGKHVEALRGQQRWGVGSVQQAFAGYAALPAKRGPDCWEQLGLGPTATEDQVMQAYRLKVRKVHPDSGGSVEAFNELVAAKDIALATIASRKGTQP